MPYTKRYYLDFMAALEYRPVKDLLAYLYESTGEIPPRVVRFAERAGERTGVTIRTFDRSRSAEEVKCMFDIYNRAWEKNSGFIPMDEAEFRYSARNMGQVLDPTLALLAEKDGRSIGFSLTVPDYNPLFKKMNGRLLPFGFLHFFFGRRSIRRIRIVAFGVLKEYHNRGVEPLLMYHTFRNALLRGHRVATCRGSSRKTSSRGGYWTTWARFPTRRTAFLRSCYESAADWGLPRAWHGRNEIWDTA